LPNSWRRFGLAACKGGGKVLMNLSKEQKSVMDYMDKIAAKRDRYIKRNRYYYKKLLRFLKYNIPERSRILEIGCGTGYVLNSLNPSIGVGVDISGKMIEIAKNKYGRLKFVQSSAEDLALSENEKFDFILISDTLGFLADIQKTIAELAKVSTGETRIILTYHSTLWHPFLKLAEKLHLKMPTRRLNWFNQQDTINILKLENMTVIKKGQLILCPKFIPVISWFCNKYLSQLPFFRLFCFVGYTIAKPETPAREYSVSVIIPARNERGNIENAVLRMPEMGKHTEIIFVEGHSKDGTLDEIKRVCEMYSRRWDLKYAVQDGIGKADAVRKGFAMAAGDILMILDADLTVPPEELPKFYNAVASGRAEYVNGSRLVYPLEDKAMRFLNILGNKFFAVTFSWLLGQRLKDTLCGTKVLSKKNWEKIAENREYFGDFDPFGDFDIIFGASKLNLKIMEVPIRYQNRQYGETQISRFTHGWLLLKMTAFAAKKIKFI
jgi:ubiquinone/menaquinone biosynthesis C-methylase UbiE